MRTTTTTALAFALVATAVSVPASAQLSTETVYQEVRECQSWVTNQVYSALLFLGNTVHGLKCQVVNSPPYKASTPTGPGNALQYETKTYCSSATDLNDYVLPVGAAGQPFREYVKIEFDWGDGSSWTTTGYAAAGSTLCASHQWMNPSLPFTYCLRTRGIDDTWPSGAIGPWSDCKFVAVEAGSPFREAESRNSDAGLCSGGESVRALNYEGASGGQVLELPGEGCWAQWNNMYSGGVTTIWVRLASPGNECGRLKAYLNGAYLGQTPEFCGAGQGGSNELQDIWVGASVGIGYHNIRLEFDVTVGNWWANTYLDTVQLL